MDYCWIMFEPHGSIEANEKFNLIDRFFLPDQLLWLECYM